MEGKMNKFIIVASIFSGLLLLTACSSEESEVEEKPLADNLSCVSQCSSLISSFDNKTSTLFDTPNENPDQTNARLNHVISPEDHYNNYVFSATAEQVFDESSNLQATFTNIVFGHDAFPIVGESYGLVDPIYVYYKRNNGIPYIKDFSFRILTKDGLSFAGNIFLGQVLRIRDTAPVEYWGDEISEFHFKLLEASIDDDSANVRYQLSFSFINNGTSYSFEQIVSIKNNGEVSLIIPTLSNSE